MNENETSGGNAARNGIGPLWTFSSHDDITFTAPNAENISRLYFPLMNSAGMKSWVNPELKGDICSSFSHYLTPPTVTEELQRTVSSRNCWVSIEGKKPWSATGMSAWQKAEKWTENQDSSVIEGQPGVFVVKRNSDDLKIASKMTVFIPETDDMVELVLIEIENTDVNNAEIEVTYSIPLYGRHADNFRDHRQVTTMFQKNFLEKFGVRIKPNIVHDEHGHVPNNMNYSVAGIDQQGEPPKQIWVSMMDFVGEGGTLDNPESVFSNLNAPFYQDSEADGKEAIGAFRFSKIKLKPHTTTSFIIIHGISEDEAAMDAWIPKYGSHDTTNKILEETKDFWNDYTSSVKIDTADSNFDKWVRWVIYQVKGRQVFGNSFLPDFGYGRGGRGWRDLWQDLLSIFLVDPESARNEIVNNFKGVRVDGTNATIIGTKPGEFISDRNNVPRSWCDHGAWPAFLLNFYIQQTGDFNILFEALPYWKDQFTSRSKVIDKKWSKKQGQWQLDDRKDIYEGIVFEHILMQQLSAFYNVGEHNILLLEGADWNDTYDMAREKGESVGFYAFYGKNLKNLADVLIELKKQGIQKIELLEELSILLDRLPSQEIVNYASPKAKQERLYKYFDSTRNEVSGKKIAVDIDDLMNDLIAKSDHITEVVQQQEWIQLDDQRGFFNGHYDNLGQAIDGIKESEVQMDLTTQVMSIMNGIASHDQINGIMQSANDFLKDEDSKGYRLCRPFKTLDLNIGRLTGFVYGYKEHGSKWMQQNIMLSYGLFTQGFSKKASEVINDVYQLSTQSGRSKIFPGVPSYFEPGDRGAYAYLTGSSAWLVLAITTQLFGVRGENGNLCLEPQLAPEHFNKEGKASIECSFRNKNIKVEYLLNVEASQNKISSLNIGGHQFNFGDKKKDKVIIKKEDFDKLTFENQNIIQVKLN